MVKIWNINQYDDENIRKIQDKYNCSEIMARLLTSRNIEFSHINDFLNGKLDDIKDPYLMKDMDKFVNRVLKAVENKEKICIYGDYDVDGITSITVLYKFLKGLNANVVSPSLDNR